MLFAATMSTVVSGNSNNHSQLTQLSALATHIFLAAHALVSNLSRWFFEPFIFLYPSISYLVSPLLHFVAIIANLVFITPLAATRYLLTSLYPLYVFCGVACITGIAVGMTGRALSAFLTSTLVAEPEQDLSASVPTISGNERRSRRRSLRIREEHS